MTTCLSTSPRVGGSNNGVDAANQLPKLGRGLGSSTTSVELESAPEHAALGTEDIQSRNVKLCAAWGLLLRCYTGRDEVQFHLREDEGLRFQPDAAVSPTQTFAKQLSFQEIETIADVIEGAKERRCGPARKNEVDSEETNDAHGFSEFTNTAIEIYKSPIRTKATSSHKVSPVFPFYKFEPC